MPPIIYIPLIPFAKLLKNESNAKEIRVFIFIAECIVTYLMLLKNESNAI